MGQFLQDGKNGSFVSSRAFVNLTHKLHMGHFPQDGENEQNVCVCFF